MSLGRETNTGLLTCFREEKSRGKKKSRLITLPTAHVTGSTGGVGTNKTGVYRDLVASQSVLVALYVFLPVCMAMFVPTVRRHAITAWLDRMHGPSPLAPMQPRLKNGIDALLSHTTVADSSFTPHNLPLVGPTDTHRVASFRVLVGNMHYIGA